MLRVLLRYVAANSMIIFYFSEEVVWQKEDMTRAKEASSRNSSLQCRLLHTGEKSVLVVVQAWPNVAFCPN